MIEIAFSSSFKRAFKKKIASNPNVETRFWERVETFKNNPFDSKLRTHKLSGKLKDLWSFSIEYDLRIIVTTQPICYEAERNQADIEPFSRNNDES